MPSECSDLCPQLSRVCKPKSPAALCPPPEITRMWQRDRGYSFDYADESVLKYSCLLNYHYVSGNMERRCQPNGTWSGRELLCHVDFFKQRYILSFMIISLTFVLFFMFLSVDIFFFISKRERKKEDKARYKIMPAEFTKAVFTVNKRCVPYYNRGTIHPKTMNRPARCLYPSVIVDWSKLKVQGDQAASGVDKFDFLMPHYVHEVEGIGRDKTYRSQNSSRLRASTYHHRSTYNIYKAETKKRKYATRLSQLEQAYTEHLKRPRHFGLLFKNFNERRLRNRQEEEDAEQRWRRGPTGRPLFHIEDTV